MNVNRISNWCEDKFMELGIEQMVAERNEEWIKYGLLGVEMNAINIVACSVHKIQQIKRQTV